MFLKISQNSQENACARVFFLIKFQAEASKFIKKETLAQVLFGEFCQTFLKKTFFIEHLQATASVYKYYMGAVSRDLLQTCENFA